MRIEQIIGQNVEAVRRERGLKQVELAALVSDELGKAWTGKTVSVAESGGRAFAAAEVVALASVLGTTVARLFEPPVQVNPSVRDGRTVGRGPLVGYADRSPEGVNEFMERLRREVEVSLNVAREVRRLASIEQEQAEFQLELLTQFRDGETDHLTPHRDYEELVERARKRHD